MALATSGKEKEEVTEYLEAQLGKSTQRKLSVQHVEKISAENIAGHRYELWNCITNQGNWWVLTPLMNFYSQKDFKSADVVLTFHVGMVARILSRDDVPIAPELADAFTEPWRKWEDAVETLKTAREAEDFQAVGMRLREAYVSMLKMVADDDLLPDGTERPKDADNAWLGLFADYIAPGSSNSRLRTYLKVAGKETWQHVNWLTHATHASLIDAEIAVANVSHLISVFTVSILRHQRGSPARCEDCGSYRLSGGTCQRWGWVNEAYVPPEPRPEPSPEDMGVRLSTPHTTSSDITTFKSPNDDSDKA
ncbi:hypothetical protein [Frondihabitans sp. Leaf304]|uniref:hypothetical protein n=1 Tax=Frondihabitans sp. Leaf304 TaxID=1736329 RepID=UPI0006FBBF12|nr:hypothetical protein [Frondihabitans sp. Leaf304]KQQ26896.1 hypothetical protein ASF54_13220 [Frondihabitans sp. Leaf304]